MEGDPPWIASMYKPDPRLPPDQQMLPTHAKRLAQEQWEKEGKTGTIYDRDFRLLNAECFPTNPRASMIEDAGAGASASAGGAANMDAKTSTRNSTNEEDKIKTTVLTSHWPLSGTSLLDSPRSINSQRPGTSGGYKTIPTIPSPKTQPPAQASPRTTMQQPLRMPEPPAKQEGKKKNKEDGGCCGCVVM
jgi:hypothetical protein